MQPNRILLAVPFALIHCGAFAQVAYSNFGTGYTYDLGSGATLSGKQSVVNSRRDQGFQFISGRTGTVASIQAALAWVIGTNAATLSLYNDNNGMLGSLLLSANLTSLPALTGQYFTPTKIAPTSSATLLAGSKYWLVATSAPDAWLSWQYVTTGVQLPRYMRMDDGSSIYDPGKKPGAFEIVTKPLPSFIPGRINPSKKVLSGTEEPIMGVSSTPLEMPIETVPEPTTAAVIAAGMVSWIRRRRKS